MKSIQYIFLWLMISVAASAQLSGWEWQNPHPQGSDLFSVAVIDANTATAVGAFGTILRTTNGGGPWRSSCAAVR